MVNNALNYRILKNPLLPQKTEVQKTHAVYLRASLAPESQSLAERPEASCVLRRAAHLAQILLCPTLYLEGSKGPFLGTPHWNTEHVGHSLC